MRKGVSKGQEPTAPSITDLEAEGQAVEQVAEQQSASIPTEKRPSGTEILVQSIQKDAFDDKLFKKGLKISIEETSERHSKTAEKYNILVVYDETTLMRGDADLIYNAVSSFDTKKPILLILHSGGGLIEAGFSISKLCRESAEQSFIVAVPRYAKSAATLICCGADEVHMGAMSELGPIDPQINNLPALGLKSAVLHIAELTSLHPSASDMFANYLHKSMQLIHLGFYERVVESAEQYAIRLLGKRNIPGDNRAEIARRLVYDYKDHGFVIDDHEAIDIFGPEFIKRNTEEYAFANSLYGVLAFAKRIADVKGMRFYLTGSLMSEPQVFKRWSDQPGD